MEKKEKIRGNVLRYFCISSVVLLFLAAFLFDSPRDIFAGMGKIHLKHRRRRIILNLQAMGRLFLMQVL